MLSTDHNAGFPPKNDEITWFFACWYTVWKLKVDWNFFGGDIVKNGCCHACHKTPALGVSQK